MRRVSIDGLLGIPCNSLFIRLGEKGRLMRFISQRPGTLGVCPRFCPAQGMAEYL